MNKSLISIIIPTYNRAHLIGETLDSIITQTYTNWECIIVDDGSTDATEKLINEYIKKDTRFQYHRRPNDRPKGANACRNYGLEVSNGVYVQWFDSDDVMHKNCLKKKIEGLKKIKADFIVSKTIFFRSTLNNINRIKYNLINKKPTLYNFVCRNQTWLTLDGLFVKKSLNQVRWNEKLFSGQEFNFISKYLAQNLTGIMLDEELAYARVHNNSIHSFQNKSTNMFNHNKYKTYMLTYSDLILNNSSQKIKSKNLVKNKLFGLIVSFAYEIAKCKGRIPNFSNLIIIVKKEKGNYKLCLFIVSLLTAFIFGKGYQIMNKSRS